MSLTVSLDENPRHCPSGPCAAGMAMTRLYKLMQLIQRRFCPAQVPCRTTQPIDPRSGILTRFRIQIRKTQTYFF
jgi:hypothetical protein